VLAVLAGEKDGGGRGGREGGGRRRPNRRRWRRRAVAEKGANSGFPAGLGPRAHPPKRILHRYRKGREGGREEGTERIRVPGKVQIVASEESLSGRAIRG